MTEIVLEKKYAEKDYPGGIKEGDYLGKIVVYEADLTPEFLAKLRADTDDRQGWKKYRKVMKEQGYDIGAVEID